MKIRQILGRMLNMCPDAWYIFIRTLQLCAFLLLCAFVLMLECSGRLGRDYTLYMTAVSLNETSQCLLLIAVILSVIIEDIQT